MIPALRRASDESHFNVSVGSVGQSHRTVSTDHNLFEEKGEPERYQADVLPLTSLAPYRWATPAHGTELDLFCFLAGPLGPRPCTATVLDFTHTETNLIGQTWRKPRQDVSLLSGPVSAVQRHVQPVAPQ